jgi:hypothetical protein
MYDEEGTASQHGYSVLNIMISMEISEIDRRFHEDVMRGRGNWWKDPNNQPLLFLTLWTMLEHRTKDVCTYDLVILEFAFSNCFLACGEWGDFQQHLGPNITR